MFQEAATLMCDNESPGEQARWITTGWLRAAAVS